MALGDIAKRAQIFAPGIKWPPLGLRPAGPGAIDDSWRRAGSDDVVFVIHSIWL
jgi:hypothetical protein